MMSQTWDESTVEAKELPPQDCVAVATECKPVGMIDPMTREERDEMEVAVEDLLFALRAKGVMAPTAEKKEWWATNLARMAKRQLLLVGDIEERKAAARRLLGL